MSGERSKDIQRDRWIDLVEEKCKTMNTTKRLIPTRHLGFRSFMVYGLAGQGVDPDLSYRYRGVLQLTVETQDLGTFTGMLHHLVDNCSDHMTVLQVILQSGNFHLIVRKSFYILTVY